MWSLPARNKRFQLTDSVPLKYMRNWFKKHPSTPPRVSSDTSPNGVYSELRHVALGTNRTEARIATPSAEAPAWGVLMETGHGEVTVTLLALADGTRPLLSSCQVSC